MRTNTTNSIKVEDKKRSANTIFKGKLEILKSLGGFYDGLAFSPTGLNRLHISYNTLHYNTSVIILHIS